MTQYEEETRGKNVSLSSCEGERKFLSKRIERKKSHSQQGVKGYAWEEGQEEKSGWYSRGTRCSGESDRFIVVHWRDVSKLDLKP